MSKFKPTPEIQYAVFTAHGERCYLCWEMIDLASMQVDHLLPEHLQDDPERFAEARKQFDLPPTFELNSFENWLPACVPCNRRKHGIVPDPKPINQLSFQIAASKAALARELAAKRVSRQTITKGWNSILRAEAKGELPDEVRREILEFADFHREQRLPELAEAPINLTPNLRVIEMQVFKGPYGVGVGPVGPGVSDGMRCGSCGSTFFNGPRCVLCGEMGD